MTVPDVTVCASCPAGRDGFAAALREALGGAGLAVRLRETECLSGCTRPSSVAVRAPGKMAYLFGDIGPADIPDLLIFLRMYLAAPDGTLADARPIGALRTKALARIPG